MIRLTLLVALLAAACEPAGTPPVSLPAMALDRPPAEVDAGPPPGRCPPDAPWNGRVCLGMGYVACPGEKRLDDGGACTSAADDETTHDGGSRR